MAALQGVSLGARPDLWQPYGAGRAQVLQAAKPIADLKTRFPARAADIDAALAGRPASSVAYLPLASRSVFWTVLIDRTTAEVLAFVPIDSF